MSLLTDRDLLRIEPTAFVAAAPAATMLLTTADAAVAGTTLTSATADFAAAGIDASHVALFDVDALEVVSRLSATELEVSRPRATSDDAKIAPTAASDKNLKIHTFARLIARTQAELLQALSIDGDDPQLPLEEGAIVNPAAIAGVLALRVLQRAFAIAAALDPGDLTLAERAAMFASQARAAAAGAVVWLDLDGDGEADQARRLNVASLRRA